MRYLPSQRRARRVTDGIKDIHCCDERSTVVRSLGLTSIQMRARSLFRTLKPVGGENAAAEPSQATRRFKACSNLLHITEWIWGADCRHTGLKTTDAEDFLRILAQIIVGGRGVVYLSQQVFGVGNIGLCIHFPALLRCNWHITSCKFNVHNDAFSLRATLLCGLQVSCVISRTCK